MSLSLAGSFSIGATSFSYFASSSLYLVTNSWASSILSFVLAFSTMPGRSLSTKSLRAFARLASGCDDRNLLLLCEFQRFLVAEVVLVDRANDRDRKGLEDRRPLLGGQLGPGVPVERIEVAGAERAQIERDHLGGSIGEAVRLQAADRVDRGVDDAARQRLVHFRGRHVDAGGAYRGGETIPQRTAGAQLLALDLFRRIEVALGDKHVRRGAHPAGEDLVLLFEFRLGTACNAP